MTATIPTQEQVDQVVRELAPDVVRIRFNTGRDWSDYPAIYFRVLLSNEASRGERLGAVAREAKKKLSDELGLEELEQFPYFSFRNLQEQAELQDPKWE